MILVWNTKAYNAIPNTNTRAFGLVDSDFRTVAEINDLKSNGIFTYQVAEIENVFLVEDFLKGLKEYHRLDGDIDKIKSNIITLSSIRMVGLVQNWFLTCRQIWATLVKMS